MSILSQQNTQIVPQAHLGTSLDGAHPSDSRAGSPRVGEQVMPLQVYRQAIEQSVNYRYEMFVAALQELGTRAEILAEAAQRLVETLRSGHKVLVAGNGGSAAEAQHFAAELVGRFKRERSPYAVLSLTSDTSILTAIANDYGYHDVFARQVYALGQPGDLFMAFSTSGESENLLRAAQAASLQHMSVVAVTGDRSSRLASLADVTVRVPAIDTAIAQELHMIVTHMLCDITESTLSAYEIRAGI